MMTVANCGHRERKAWLTVDRNGYTKCLNCMDRETATCILYASRVEAQLAGTRVVSLTGLPVGTVVERVGNEASRTPTGGKYKSDRMTVRDMFGGKWYANGPREGGPDGRIILRRAEVCLADK